MILISSSAYVVSEFQVELGKIPPCFLPLGNKKLLEHQAEQLKIFFPHEKIVVSLPESFQLSSSDIKLIHQLGIEYIFVSDEFSLSESISFVLNVIDENWSDTLKIIYGDTLLLDIPKDNEIDTLGLALSGDGYEWHVEKIENDIPLIWCGFYIFSDRRLLLKSLALNRNYFVDAVERYRTEKTMTTYIFSQWFDLGHINTYFRSRAVITTQRAFNELKIENGVLYKTGSPSIKIEAEGAWFTSIPSFLRIYIPQLIDRYKTEKDQAFYALEYLPNLPLNELFVHGKNHSTEWKMLFELIHSFFTKSASIDLPKLEQDNLDRDFIQLVNQKTWSRLEQYANTEAINLDDQTSYYGEALPSLRFICETCINLTLKLSNQPSILHGDLCFSNILFDFKAQRIKVIDPRGLNIVGDFTIYGDQKYDLAKLSHSVIGLYDHIIAGRYHLIESDKGVDGIEFDIDKRILNIQNYFMKIKFIKNLKISDIMPLVVLLFLSMLPLHSDRPDRQKAMLINALRIYKKFIYKI